MSLKWYFETDSLKLFFPRNAQLHSAICVTNNLCRALLVSTNFINKPNWLNPPLPFFTQRKFYLKIRMVLWPILYIYLALALYIPCELKWLVTSWFLKNHLFILKKLLGKFYRANKKDMGQCMHHSLSLSQMVTQSPHKAIK
jgi:hypothetical protein